MFDDGAVVALDRALQGGFVAIECRAPHRVAARRGDGGGIDEIGEQDGRQLPLGGCFDRCAGDEFGRQLRDESGIESQDVDVRAFDGDALGVGEDAVPPLQMGDAHCFPPADQHDRWSAWDRLRLGHETFDCLPIGLRPGRSVGARCPQPTRTSRPFGERRVIGPTREDLVDEHGAANPSRVRSHPGRFGVDCVEDCEVVLGHLVVEVAIRIDRVR